MLFNYDTRIDRNNETVPYIEFDYRDLKTEADWQALRDIIGAIKIQLDCNCHVELDPLKETLMNYHKLKPDAFILRIDIYIETWKVQSSNKKSLLP